MNIAIVLGTRPEIIKLAEICRLLKERKDVKTYIVFTGQHYSKNLFDVFMQELEVPAIDINLDVGSGTNAYQVAEMRKKIEEFLRDKAIDVVVAEGDTNSVLAAALASHNLGVKFAHVEAGLRSFDRSMPEEINRILADKISHFLFAPTKVAVENLAKSKATGRVFLTGNTIVENLGKNIQKAQNSKILEKLQLESEKYAVLTAHRKENVDNKQKLQQLVSAIGKVGVKIIFPMHPRTEKMLKKFGLLEKVKEIKNLQIIEPIGYFDFIKLCQNCMFILTDSGGIQEEASIYKKPVVVLRENTERPEILGIFGELVGFNEEKIVKESNRIIDNYDKIREKLVLQKSPFGDGTASNKIVEIILGE